MITPFLLATIINFNKPYTSITLDNKSNGNVVITSMVTRECSTGGPITLALAKTPSDFDPAQVFVQANTMTFTSINSYVNTQPGSAMQIPASNVIYINWQAPVQVSPSASCEVDLVGFESSN